MSRKKQNVLDEDNYLRQIDKIVERDFYPESEMLAIENAYMDAESRNDFETMKNLLIQRRQLEANDPSLAERTPLSDRFMPETSLDKLGYTPSKDEEEDERFRKTDDNWESEDPGENSTMTLNGYLSQNTSEDNYTYHKLTREIDHKKHLAKYRWVYELDNKHRKHVPYATVDGGLGIGAKEKLKKEQDKLAIEYKNIDPIKLGPDGQPIGVGKAEVAKPVREDASLYSKPKDPNASRIMNNWRYISKNNVMFYQEAIGSKHDDGKFKKPKHINFAGTRFREKDPYKKQVERMRIEKAAQQNATYRAGQVQKDGSTINKDGSWTPSSVGISSTGNHTPGHTPSKIHSFGDGTPLSVAHGLMGTPLGNNVLGGASGGTPFNSERGFVPSTPVITPGKGLDESPLMTWGTLGTTPKAITPSMNSDQTPDDNRYSLPGVTKREIMANRMVEKIKLRAQTKTTSAFSRGKKSIFGKTPDRTFSMLSSNRLTPSAQRLARSALGNSTKRVSRATPSPMVKLGKRTPGSTPDSMVKAKLSKLTQAKSAAQTPGYTPITTNLI